MLSIPLGLLKMIFDDSRLLNAYHFSECIQRSSFNICDTSKFFQQGGIRFWSDAFDLRKLWNKCCLIATASMVCNSEAVCFVT